MEVDLRDYNPNPKQDQAHRSNAPVLLYGGGADRRRQTDSAGEPLSLRRQAAEDAV